jgi:hypothetical protein
MRRRLYVYSQTVEEASSKRRLEIVLIIIKVSERLFMFMFRHERRRLPNEG